MEEPSSAPEDPVSAAPEAAAAVAPEAPAQEEVVVPSEQPQPEEVQVAPAAAAAEKDPKEGSDSDDEEDDEDVIEESPCGRYIKRREVVKYRDVPGVDTAFLAMDTEEGVEVVWNEAVFSGTKKFKSKEEAKLKNVFEALTLIDHPNIVKFHRYWTDNGGNFNEKSGQTNPPRLVFITEFMSSGTLKQFLRKTKRNNRKIQVQSWKRWCTQILSALNYLHATCDPPILHGNLTCDTIFIQHNGLVKIGSVAPDIIHQNVKTCRDNIARNKHFLAPEWGLSSSSNESSPLNTAIDIYAFGMCALETAALELSPAAQPAPNGATASSATAPNGAPSSASASSTSGASGAPSAGASGASTASGASASVGAPSTSAGATASTSTNGHHQNGANGNPEYEGGVVTEECIQRTIGSLEDEMQKDFIRKCLRKAPEERPTAGELLFHPVLFEVHSLKLLAAHILVNTPANINETMTDEAIQTHYGRDTVMATVKRMSDGKIKEYKLSDFPVAEKLEKFMEDVKYGIYPLTAFALSQPPPPGTRAVTPSEGPNESAQSVTPEPLEPEDRWGIEFKCYIGPPVPAPPTQLTLLTKLCDGMNRQMQAGIKITDNPEQIALELLDHAIINWRDVPSIAKLMTMGFIQRANETAEYIAMKERNPSVSDDTANNDGTSDAPEKPPQMVGVQNLQAVQAVTGVQPVPAVQAQPVQAEADSTQAPSEPVEEVNDDEVFEDPTPPQALEGRLAGVEPIIGTPQTTLEEAVAAGSTRGGLHFPREKLRFSGMVADIDQKLQAEIAEWQKRMQEYLVDQQQPQQQQQQNVEGAAAQNGAQADEHHPQAEEAEEPPQPQRSSSQLRE